MKKKIVLSIVLMLVFVLSFYALNHKYYRIKSYTSNLEMVNNFLLKNSIENLKLNDNLERFPFLKSMIKESELCEVEYYKEKGIVYKFQCKTNSSNNFFSSDNKYYLIKVLNENKDLLIYPQFVDYAKKPKKIKNNWYFVEQNITYD